MKEYSPDLVPMVGHPDVVVDSVIVPFHCAHRQNLRRLKGKFNQKIRIKKILEKIIYTGLWKFFRHWMQRMAITTEI